MDGLTAQEHSLPGKPAPDMFIHAAAALGIPVQRCVVVEDAVSGVLAGAAAGAGYVLGVDRSGDGAALLAAGANLVVNDLAQTGSKG